MKKSFDKAKVIFSPLIYCLPMSMKWKARLIGGKKLCGETKIFEYLLGGHTPSPYTTRSRKTTRHIHISNIMPNNTPKKPRATQRPPDDYNPDMKYGKSAF